MYVALFFLRTLGIFLSFIAEVVSGQSQPLLDRSMNKPKVQFGSLFVIFVVPFSFLTHSPVTWAPRSLGAPYHSFCLRKCRGLNGFSGLCKLQTKYNELLGLCSFHVCLCLFHILAMARPILKTTRTVAL